MNIKKLLLITLVAGITMWLFAGLVHEVIFPKFFADETEATHEGTGIIFLAYIILGLLMSYLYSLTYKGGRPAIEGLKLGILIGILWVFHHELAMAGAHGESISYVFINGAWHMIEQGVGGILIGLVYAKI
jgi:hypothetical protein